MNFGLLIRLFNEASDVVDKLEKLSYFMKTTEFMQLTRTEQELLNKQYDIMVDYLNVLLTRINYMVDEDK
jgi:hypothetical protein